MSYVQRMTNSSHENPPRYRAAELRTGKATKKILMLAVSVMVPDPVTRWLARFVGRNEW